MINFPSILLCILLILTFVELPFISGGTLRIFGETLNPDVPYKTLLLSTRDTASAVVREILEKYGRDRDEAAKYCLVQLIHSMPHSNIADVNSVHDFNGNPGVREYILDDDDCPLAIERQHNSRTRGSLSFHIRQRPADYQPRKRKKQPNVQRGDLMMDRLQFPQDNRADLNEAVQNENGNLPPLVNGSERSASTNSQSNSQYCPSEEVGPVPPSPTVEQATTNSAVYDSTDNQRNSINQPARPASQSSQLYQFESRGASNMGPPQGAVTLPQPLARGNNGQYMMQPVPEVQVYLMHKGDGGMGLSIVATKGCNQVKIGIYIKSVVPGGAAARVSFLIAYSSLFLH